MGRASLVGTLLVLASLVGSQLKQPDIYDYCDPKFNLCEVPNEHTMCKYPIAGLSAECTPAVHEPLSATEKKRIMFWHNKFRSNVANGTEKYKNRKLPTSSNMRQIYWDKELELIAIRWAEQCVSTTKPKIYDKCRNTRRFQVSQNVGTRRVNGTTIDKQAPQIIITWYKESKDFDPALVDKFLPGGDDKLSTRQFANIIWADTYAIGCARVVFQEQLPVADKESKKTSVWTIERLVCNYGPGGNEIGKPVYKRGTSCENCPERTQCSFVYPGLCAMPNAEKLEAQQNLENQESKEAKTESETSTQEMEFTSESSGTTPTETTPKSEESELEDVDKFFSSNNQLPEEVNKLEEETKMKTASGGCPGEDCPKATPSTPSVSGRPSKDRQRPPKNTAGIKCRGFGRKVPAQGNETIVNNRIRKWIPHSAEKTLVGKPRNYVNGDPCHCYVYNRGSSQGISFLLFLLFSCFLFTLY